MIQVGNSLPCTAFSQFSRFRPGYYCVRRMDLAYFDSIAPQMKREFKPGDFVPVSGIYRVEHKSHRLMHEAALLAQSRFPCCRECRTAVRFHLLREVNGRILPFRSSAILEEFNRPVLLDRENSGF